MADLLYSIHFEMKIFTSLFFTWFPNVFFGSVFALSFIFIYLKKETFPKYPFFKKLRLLIVIVIFFRVSYSLALSIAQYYLWSQEEFSRLLLPPNQPMSYFIGYAFIHFWLEQLLAIAGALVFYIFLTLLRKYKESWISREEILLGFLMALLVGWPNLVIFIPLVFLSAVGLAIINMVALRVKHTGLYFSLMLAGLITFVFGSIIIKFSGLTVLQV